MNRILRVITTEILARIVEWEGSDPESRTRPKAFADELGIKLPLFYYHVAAAKRKRMAP